MTAGQFLVNIFELVEVYMKRYFRLQTWGILMNLFLEIMIGNIFCNWKQRKLNDLITIPNENCKSSLKLHTWLYNCLFVATDMWLRGPEPTKLWLAFCVNYAVSLIAHGIILIRKFRPVTSQPSHAIKTRTHLELLDLTWSTEELSCASFARTFVFCNVLWNFETFGETTKLPISFNFI